MTRWRIRPREGEGWARREIVLEGRARVVLVGEQIERVTEREAVLLRQLAQRGNAPLPLDEIELCRSAAYQAAHRLRGTLAALGFALAKTPAGYQVALPASPERKSDE